MPGTDELTSRSIGYRIRAARDAKGLTQDALSAAMGIPDRQTISDMENGKRAIKAEELVQLTEILGVPLDYLLDPFSVAGEANFSWRASNELEEGPLRAFEHRTSRVIGLLRWLRRNNSEQADPLKHTLRIGKDSTYEFVQERAAQLARSLDLGEIPATNLVEKIEDQLDIPVLYVDIDELPKDTWISGATCHLQDLGVILINRNEPAGRRNFDLAHELFHALTWDTLPPDRREKSKRAEQLANNFAASLLMPIEALDLLIDERRLDDPAHISQVAGKLGVSVVALAWRLFNLKRIKAEFKTTLLNMSEEVSKTPRPKLYSKSFTALLNTTIARGRLSARKASKALGMDLNGLAQHFGEYGMSTPFEV